MGQVLCPVLVGREAELAALGTALDAALGGRGGCAVLTGEAGIGKSRLIRELSQRAAAQGLPMVTGRAVPASTTTPYRPVTEALLQLLRVRPLTGGPRDPALARWLPHLAALLPGAVSGGLPAPLAGGADAHAARGEAVLQLVRSLAPRGLVIALEDLHWARAWPNARGTGPGARRARHRQRRPADGAGRGGAAPSPAGRRGGGQVTRRGRHRPV